MIIFILYKTLFEFYFPMKILNQFGNPHQYYFLYHQLIYYYITVEETFCFTEMDLDEDMLNNHLT